MVSRDRPNIIPLTRCIVCEDCGCISDGKNSCPACGSSAVWALHRVLEPQKLKEVIALENMLAGRERM